MVIWFIVHWLKQFLGWNLLQHRTPNPRSGTAENPIALTLCKQQCGGSTRSDEGLFSNALVKRKVFRRPALALCGMGRKPKSRRNSYGAWLHYLRTDRGLTQEQLARMVGVPQTTLAYWERTGRLRGREIVLGLAEALGVSLTDLLRPGKKKTAKK